VSERVVERVRKLLALSRSSNPHEASSAAEKARELVEKYKLSQAVIEPEEEGATIDSFDYATRVNPWVRDLAFVISRGFFCRAIHTPRGKDTAGRSWLHFVGKAEDVELAKEVFAFLRRELKRMAAAAIRERADYIRGAPEGFAKDWKLDFFNGAIFTIDSRLRARARRFEEAPASSALVRVIEDGIKKKLDETFKELRPKETGAPIRSLNGWIEGSRAGAKVPLGEKTLPRRTT